MEQKRKIPNDRPKLIKRDSKVKKVNNQVNVTGNKSNKKNTSITKNDKTPKDSVRKRKNNEIPQNKIDNKTRKNNIINSNKNDNRSIKQRFQDYINQQNMKIEDINYKQKKFNNIDEAVILIQRCFRKYLDKIHNTNSNLMKLINQRKKNLLDNYNNDGEIILNLLERNNSDKKQKKLNEDLIIDEKNNLKDNIYNKDMENKKNMKININIEDINNNEGMNFKNNNSINNNSENQYSVFEKIYKNMQNHIKDNINDINNNYIENNQFGLDDELIEKNDSIINNQFDMIKNIQKRAIENLSYNKHTEDENTIDNIIEIKEENKEKSKEDIKEIEEIIKEEMKEDLKEEKKEEAKKEVKEEEKNNEINLNININSQENQNDIKEDKNEKERNNINDINNNLANQDIMNNSNEEEKKTEEKITKNEIFQRLANFLDSTVENPEKIEVSPKKEEIQPQPEIHNPKENSENILTKDNTENIGLNLELKEAKKTIEAMSSVIDDLKLQLKSKDDFLNKALLSQKNENDILLQRFTTAEHFNGIIDIRKKKYGNAIIRFTV